LSKQLGIQEDELDVLRRKLETEQAINEERRLQSRLGSESVRLFNIAQTEGVQVAREIGDVLAGNLDFASFVRRGGQALDVFKRDFEGLFEQQQALAFFRGETSPGVNTLRGGAGIAIQEQAIRGNVAGFNAQAQLAQSRAVQSVPRIQADIRSRLDVFVNGLDFTQAKSQIKEELITELTNPEGEFTKALDQRLDNF
jgi:hypothetical protein